MEICRANSHFKEPEDYANLFICTHIHTYTQTHTYTNTYTKMHTYTKHIYGIQTHKYTSFFSLSGKI